MRIKPLFFSLLFLLFSKLSFAHSGGVWIANDGCGNWYAIVFHWHNNSSTAAIAANASAGLYLDFNQNGVFDVNGQQYSYTNVSGFTTSNNEFNRFTDWINLTDKSGTGTSYANDASIQNEVLNWLNTNKRVNGRNYSLSVAISSNSSSTWYEALVVKIKPLSPGIYKASTTTSSATETPDGYSNPFNITYTPPANFTNTTFLQSTCGDNLKVSSTLTQTCVQEYGVVYSTTNQQPAVGGTGVTQQAVWSGGATDLVNQAYEYNISVPSGDEFKTHYVRTYYKQVVGSETFYVYSTVTSAVPLDPNLDCDSDGISNGIETTQSTKDTDGDGIFDFRDTDSDNDGIPDNTETGTTDCDADGILDFQDLSLIPNITSQPANRTICNGSNTTFTATVTGGGLSYQWQVDTGSGFVNIANSSPYSGVTTNTLTLTNPGATMSGYKYRLIINSSTCSTTATSAEATLSITVIAPPTVSNVSYYNNDAASALTATGTNLKWYSLETGGTGSASAPTPSTSVVGTQDYWVSQTVGGCESLRAKITVTVNPSNEVIGTATTKNAYYPQASFVDDQIVVLGKNVTNARVFISAGFQANQDVLSAGTLPAGITQSYSASTGVLSFTGSATSSTWQSIFRSVKFSSTSSNTANRTILFVLGDAVSLTIGGKPHYYQYINNGSAITWTNAKTAAASKTLFGLVGYLATITSQAENDFIKDKLASDGWVGGTDNTSAIANASEGNWYWATGPEAGTWISQGNNSPVLKGPYMNWNPFEPNDSGSNEDYMQLYSAQQGKWNDLPDNSSSIKGYVVEYGGYANDPVITIEASRTLTYYVPAIPSTPVLSGGLNNSTNDTTPQITGTSDPNVTINIYSNNVLLGTSTADANGNWSYTFTTTLSDGAYSISASATDLSGFTGNKSSNLSITIDTQGPSAPTGLNAQSGDSQITLSWTANTEGDLSGYKVYGGTSSGSTNLIQSLSSSSLTYTHSALTNGTTYYYRIKAIDQLGNESSFSIEDTEIPKANQTINFNSIAAKTYGDATFVLGDQTTSGGLTITYTASDPTILNIVGNQASILKIGSTTVTATQSGNLSFNPANSVSQTILINPKTINVTADAKTKSYGDPDPTLTYQFSPALVQGDTFSGSLSRVSGSNVGQYAINQGSLTLSTNYTLNYTGANLTVNAKTITITADAKTKTYGDPDPTLTYQFSPALVQGDTFSGSLSRVSGSNIGQYAINQGSLTLSTNYTLNYTGANLTVNAKTINVTADAKTKTYGDVDPSFTYQFTPTLIQGDSFSGSLSRVSGETPGNYNINQGNLSLNTNYNLVFSGSQLAIGKLNVTVNANPGTKTYGNPDPALTYISIPGVGTSLANGQIISFSGLLSRTSGETVNTYAINQGSLNNSNYQIAFNPSSFTITAAAATITTIGSSTICSGGTVTLRSSVNTGNQWYLNDTPINGATASEYIATIPGEYSVKVSINGSTSPFSNKITVVVNPIPTVNLPSNQTLSNGDMLSSIVFSGTVSGTSYIWTNDNTSFGLASSGTGNILSFRTNYTGPKTRQTFANISVTPVANGCTGITQNFTITLKINEDPTEISLSKANLYESNPLGALVGNFTTIDPDVNDTHFYTLAPGFGDQDNDKFTISGNQLKAAMKFDFATRTSYSIRVRTTDATGASFEKDFVITISPKPVLTGTGNTIGTNQVLSPSSSPQISKGFSSQLSVSGNNIVSYSWSPSSGLSSTNSANPIASPSQTTTYTVTVTNSQGSITSASITVKVVEDMNVTPNNIVTPNGDGQNDVWIVDNILSYPNNEVFIFDVSGRIIYQKKGYNNDLSLSTFTAGTYYYLINFGPNKAPKRGFFTVLN